MRSHLTKSLLAVPVALLLGAALLATRTPEARDKAEPTNALQAVEVALLATTIQGTQTELYVVSHGSALPTPVASFEHLAGAVVRGATLPNSRAVLAVADTRAARELSWSAALVRLEAGQETRVLVDNVYHASRPLVTAQGLVFVQRGRAGEEPSPEQKTLRVDDLAIDQVDPVSGVSQRIYSWFGYEAHLAGAYQGELFIYRVGPTTSDLVALDLGSLQLRTIVPSWPPMARDFSVDPTDGSLVLQQADDDPRGGLHVERVDTKTGVRTIVASGFDNDVGPFALAKGRLVLTAATDSAPVIVGASGRSLVRGLPSTEIMLSRVRSEDSAFVGGLSMKRGVLPVPVLVQSDTGLAVSLPFPHDKRVEVAGIYGRAQ